MKYFVPVDTFHVVEVELCDINNPSEDGSCQYFDPTKLVSIMQSVTVHRVVVARLSGSNLCELTPCSPSPCKNGGICSMKEGVKGNYECSLCRLGYTGVNCTEDVNECDQGNKDTHTLIYIHINMLVSLFLCLV